MRPDAGDCRVVAGPEGGLKAARRVGLEGVEKSPGSLNSTDTTPTADSAHLLGHRLHGGSGAAILRRPCSLLELDQSAACSGTEHSTRGDRGVHAGVRRLEGVGAAVDHPDRGLIRA